MGIFLLCMQCLSFALLHLQMLQVNSSKEIAGGVAMSVRLSQVMMEQDNLKYDRTPRQSIVRIL